ncbi:uncharacterized protein LOC122501875 [Leptopilina heterotoma]|uniref:uncharacterized protein LOC122501875 n=1 Tax=Leptopilina heterotoma TaxID=63436 RepID=UPI001CA99875|nr:uncharacterized protein LOC122501875 [Leptopilina heterotoma]
MKRPLSQKQQIKVAYKGLTPAYRRQLDRLQFESLSRMEKILRNYEKAKDLDERYAPPPPKEKMRFPSAAVKERKSGHKHVKSEKVAALEKEPESSKSDHSTKADKPKKKKKSPKSKKEKNKPEEKSVEAISPATPNQKPAMVQGQVVSTAPPPAVQMPIQFAYPMVYPGMFPPGIKPNYPRPNGSKGPKPGQHGTQAQNTTKEFVGACFHCQTVGHRAKDCPQRTCFSCQQQGHYANQCPLKLVQSQACLVCKRPGCNFLNCPNCMAVRAAMGNGIWGAQNSAVPPSNKIGQ